ncbi:MAG: enoyl-CoA hydratase-related protein [Tuberibacillus sp.]
MYETLIYEVENGVGWITLNRPDKLNAFTMTMNQELVDVLKKAERDENVRVLVIKGAGRAFCSGQDLGSVTGEINLKDTLRKGYNPMIKRLVSLEKPTVAMVNGAAAGAGMSLALACDFRVASDRASFIQAFINIGLVPDSGSLYFLPRLVGYAKALELAVFGEKIKADEAKALGLVTKVIASDDLEAETKAFAERLAAMPTKAIGLIKRYMQKSFENDLEQMLEWEAVAQHTAGQTEDAKEGVTAFLEKRKPAYRGY